MHSFHTLLEDPATVSKNRVQPKDGATPPFDIITTPSPLQQRAFDLLGLSPTLAADRPTDRGPGRLFRVKGNPSRPHARGVLK